MLDQISNFVSHNLMGAAGVIGIVIEFALRLSPSPKPLSIAYGISAVFKQIGAICSSIGAFLDKVLPQNLSK